MGVWKSLSLQTAFSRSMVAGKTAVSRWISKYTEAWLKRDAKLVASLFAENAVYQSHPFRPEAEGRGGVLEYTVGAFDLDEVYEVRFGRPVVEGGRAGVEYWGVMREDGKDVTIAGCVMLRFGKKGLCEELRDYWVLKEGRISPPKELLQGKRRGKVEFRPKKSPVTGPRP